MLDPSLVNGCAAVEHLMYAESLRPTSCTSVRHDASLSGANAAKGKLCCAIAKRSKLAHVPKSWYVLQRLQTI